MGCVPMRGPHMLNFDGMVRLMVPTAKRRLGEGLDSSRFMIPHLFS